MSRSWSFTRRWEHDPSGILGAATMLVFAGVAAGRWSSSGLLFFALTSLRDAIAAWFFLKRNPTRSNGARGAALLAYVSSALPLFYFGAENRVWLSNVLSILGYTLATLALLDLGKSFGISPANRGRVQTGFYRIFRHPIYLGYGISEVGLCLANPRNITIFLVSMALYASRVFLEERELRRI